MLNSQHELTITALANSGDGVGRIDEQVVFVPYSCPGDRLLVQITKVQKNFLKARIEKIIEESPERTVAPCSYFGVCGGCDWQHISYENQLKWKSKALEDVLIKIGKIDSPPLQPIISSPKQFNYRNRIQLEYDQKSFYLHEKGSNRLVAVDHCPLADEKINLAMHDLHKQVLSKKKKGRVELAFVNESVRYFKADKQSQTELGFQQVNSEQNQALQKIINDVVEKNQISQAIDLYCGQGNWALSIAEKFPHCQVLGVESNPINVEKAKEIGSKLENTPSFILGKSEELYDAKVTENSLVIIDPPRAGCSPELLEKLNINPPGWLIYISCHPATMSRDLMVLKQKYELLEVQPVDMFPQTAHLECLVLLRSASQVNTDQ